FHIEIEKSEPISSSLSCRLVSWKLSFLKCRTRIETQHLLNESFQMGALCLTRTILNGFFCRFRKLYGSSENRFIRPPRSSRGDRMCIRKIRFNIQDRGSIQKVDPLNMDPRAWNRIHLDFFQSYCRNSNRIWPMRGAGS